MKKHRSDDQYDDIETVRRRDAVIKQMLATPPKPHSEMKLGKSKDKKRRGSKRKSTKGSSR
jgi:hypothetical protein